MSYKTCNSCKETKHLSLFSFRKFAGAEYYYSYCKKCGRDTQRKTRRDLFTQIIKAYGGKCSCSGCDVDNYYCLSLDHVNKDGNKFRSEVSTSTVVFYEWIISNNYPDSIRLLCFNCHYGMHRNNERCPLHSD